MGGFVQGSRGLFFLLLSSLLFTISCQNSGDNKASSSLDETIILKVSKENFINGKKFCELYVNNAEKLSKESGVWLNVPKNYNQPNETTPLYVYTRKPFNPQLPTYIYLDGGPGQNTHQFEDYIAEGFNQINFDQRGVGCSTPNTWEEYSDHNIYSSKNTVRDMEEIRKHFGIEKWSVYGVSYGTIPATMYASAYASRTRSLILEGVVGSVEKLSRFDYLSEKWNLVIKSLNSKQKEAFDSIILSEKDKKANLIMQYFAMAGYRDAGFRNLKEKILFKLFPVEGGFNEDFYNELSNRYNSKRNRFTTPQQPGAVDDNILSIFYCKEFNAFDKDKYTLDYDSSLGFIERPTSSRTYWKDECAKHGISEKNQDEYDESKYSVYSNVYYLQGSHDGATVAAGAWNHWKSVPKRSVFFMLSLKGGHNPGLTKLNSEHDEIKKSHKELYIKAINAEPINNEFVNELNTTVYKYEKNENLKTVTWELFLKIPKDFSSIQGELDGIKKITR
jgi:proline iminopeptidase